MLQCGNANEIDAANWPELNEQPRKLRSIPLGKFLNYPTLLKARTSYIA
ncbi:hypothetical protein BRPE64_BCDS12320 [Caballeronia insecticola]|uniref:Uncharacterized protein n=1 Tax=Caballeronia insecticola TaxID=758793 RepID=R4WMP2_9BURK|nr:hypothetical protein BRPE64_BCDS12320 [Caballeronia insecticola]